VDSPHGERVVAITLPVRCKRVAIYRRLVESGNRWIGVSHAVDFLLFVLLVVLAVVVVGLLVYMLLRRWL
jgi:hypothetical protein